MQQPTHSSVSEGSRSVSDPAVQAGGVGRERFDSGAEGEHAAPMPPGRPFLFYLILAAGLLSFSISPILVRLAADAPGLAIAVWRTVFAVALLAPAIVVKRERPFGRFSWPEVGLIVAAGVLLGFHFVMWIESLYHTSVASASVLVTTSPVFLAVLGFVFLRERVTRAEVAGILLGVAGAVMIGLGDASGETSMPNPLLGNGLALAAAVVVSGYMIIGRVVRRRASWLGYVFPLYGVVAVTVLVTACIRSTPLFGFRPEFYGLCLLMALGPQVIGHGALNYALRYVSAAILGVLTLLEPAGATVIAYFLFGEKPAPLAAFGMLVVLASVTFVVLRQNEKRGAVEQGRVP